MAEISATEWQYIADKAQSMLPRQNMEAWCVIFVCVMFSIGFFMYMVIEDEDGFFVPMGISVAVALIAFVIYTNGNVERDYVAKMAVDYARLKANQAAVEECAEHLNNGDLTMYDRDEAIEKVSTWVKNRDNFQKDYVINNKVLLNAYSDTMTTLSQKISQSLNKEFDLFTTITQDNLDINLDPSVLEIIEPSGFTAGLS